MKNTAIHFKNVTKQYHLYKNDKKKLLAFMFGTKGGYTVKVANDHISFEIKKGESVAILGRNGAGKSTLLKIITGVVLANHGTVRVNGRVGALLELTAGFDPEFTVRENIYLKGLLLGMSKKEVALTEDAIVNFAELGEYIDQPVRTYSSGMRARLGFAIHSHTNPDILVVDEALSVGDVKFQEKCRAKTKEIINEDHVTVLFVTHSMEAAKSICTRGLVLNDGRIVADTHINEAIKAYKHILSGEPISLKH